MMHMKKKHRNSKKAQNRLCMNRQAAEHYRFLYNKMENIPEAFMNFMENLQLHSSALTKNERKAFDMILEDLKMVQTCSIQELSDQIDVLVLHSCFNT